MGSYKYKFSDELMHRGQQYFTKRAGREMSLDETESWLDSVSDLFLIFNDMRLKNNSN